MTISGGRTEQLTIFCRITGFTSDFLSFVDVELIPFVHGALQLLISPTHEGGWVCWARHGRWSPAVSHTDL